MTLRSNLMLASAMLATAVGATSANATTIFGGGSSLQAPYFRQAADCWGDKLGLAFRNNASTTTINDFNYTGVPAFNCATSEISPGNSVSYISTGSGRGILGYFAHSPFYVDPVGKTGDSWLGTGVGPAPAFFATKTNFSASDAGLPQTNPSLGGDIDTYNNGGSVKQSGVTITVQDPANTNGGTFPNPRKTYGAAVQIPLLVAVADVAFDPLYKKVGNADGTVTSYAFGNITGSAPGQIKLSNAQLCGIFQGTITNWNQVTGVTKSKSDPAPFDVPIQIVGRSDGSGTTSIVYRHLAKVCGTAIYVTDAAGNVPTSLPATLQGPAYDKTQPNNPVAGETIGKFTRADGSDGVAKYLDFTQVPTAGQTIVQGRVGYVGNDFVLPYVTNNGQNTYGLVSAALQNSTTSTVVYVTPTPLNALKAFATVLPPQTTSTGVYSVSAPGNRADPATNNTNATWVSAANINSPLADPKITGAYPLVGTTDGFFYQCYASASEASVVRGFLSWYYTSKVVNDTTKGILSLNGLAPVPTAYAKAINETFVVNPTYGDISPAPGNQPGKLNLDIQTVTAAAECSGVTTGA